MWLALQPTAFTVHRTKGCPRYSLIAGWAGERTLVLVKNAGAWNLADAGFQARDSNHSAAMSLLYIRSNSGII